MFYISTSGTYKIRTCIIEKIEYHFTQTFPNQLIYLILADAKQQIHTRLPKVKMKEKYEEENLRKIIAESTSFRQVAEALGLNKDAGSYPYTILKYTKEYGIDTSHFTGKVWNKNKKFGSKYPIEDYLSNKKKITSFKLKNKILETKIFKRQCSMCNGTEWLGKPIPIELDHINGNKHDNSLSNLRFLCPNCHAQTPTYKSKNRKSCKDKTCGPSRTRTGTPLLEIDFKSTVSAYSTKGPR